jgi:hypothetical protein
MLENAGIEVNLLIVVFVSLAGVLTIQKYRGETKPPDILFKIKNVLTTTLFFLFGFFQWDYFLMGFTDLNHLTYVLAGGLDSAFNIPLFIFNTGVNFAILCTFNFLLLKLYDYKP